MADEAVIIAVKKYLGKLQDAGFEDCFAVLYGSQVTGNHDEWSDIDILIVSSIFDSEIRREHVNLLWRIAAATDSRIEPIPVGKLQYNNDDGNALIEIARRNGQIISPAA
jgi:predicted nucleotidyltransferase